jgi:SNF2 family DNA or RNA helicase
VIKLNDRLYYLLQPPLETLLTGACLAMPFHPFPYQLTGISFLYPRHAAVMADEMGLGKTMQAITAMRLLLHSGHLRQVLLVCPKPLVTNWQREFQMWAPEIPIVVIEGDQIRRRWQWGLDEVPVKISNYEALLRDRDEVGVERRHFDLVVLDEAQRIKNRSSASHQIVCSLSRTRSWALTGTPVENTPDDLVGIFEFLVPGYLSPGMTPRRLRDATRDYIIRRTKDQVLTDLPPKLYRDALVGLSGDQQLSYHRAEKEGVVHLTNLGEAITIQHVFELVLRLKQICNFDPETGRSSKLDRLEADLEEVAASGKKAIVFSQWVSTLQELKRRLARFGPVEYHGRVSGRHREAVIDQLRQGSDTHVILMSYGAGSVGLNLQFCEYVFLFDRWWNPAVEDQAINRAHRIGAAGPVTVTRFVSLETIEERIDQILTRKRELFESLLSGTDRPGSVGLSQAEIFGLFDLQVPGGPLKVTPEAA